MADGGHYWRGHRIAFDGVKWRYCGDGLPVAHDARACSHCGHRGRSRTGECTVCRDEPLSTTQIEGESK
jgi:hypothetical protein